MGALNEATTKRRRELRRRRDLVLTEYPAADHVMLAAVVAADHYWTDEQLWRNAISARDWRDAGPVAKPAQDELAAERVDSSGPGLPRRGPRKPGPVVRVPAPGRRLRSGTGAVWTVRILAIFGPMVLAAGVAFAVGVNIGSARVPAPSAISDSDAGTYHLTSYPQTQAASLGIAFLTVCLTHPAVSDDVGLDRRAAVLAQWSTSGVPGGCGWDESGPARRPVSIVADGTITALSDQTSGQTARVGFLVTMDTGEILRVQVPIWVNGSSARVAGPIGIMPAPAADPAPPPPSYASTDPTLAGQLTPAVLTPFLAAWGASDAVQLDLQLTADASSAARQGLGGILSGPEISQNRVVVMTGEPGRYISGDLVTALVTVSWATASGGQISSYAITLRMEADRWLVTDIAGSTLDPAGGAAPTAATPSQQHQRKEQS